MYVAATSSTDTFGHALHNLSKEESAARNAMLAGQATRKKAWLATNFTKVSPKKLKKMIREGIPNSLRRELWLELSGGNLLKESLPKTYFPGLASKAAPKMLVHDVEAAIYRFMPGHQNLATPPGLLAVVSIVHAYLQHTGGRIQSNIICIAAFLVLVLGLHWAEDCFWILVGLLHHVLPATCSVKDTSAAIQVECLVLRELVQKKCPKLLAALEDMGLSVSEVSDLWFSHLFCGVLPAETTARIWDCLMSEGVKVLFRVALALLKREESKVTGNVQKLRNMEWRISRTFNADELLKMAFNGIGSFPSAVIKRSQQDVEIHVKKELQSHAQRLEALICPPRISPQPSGSSAAELPTISELC